MTEPSLQPMVWLVAAQFLVYALGWGLCGLLMTDQRKAVAHWGGFMLVLGLGFVLLAERGEPRTWWSHNGSNLAFVAGYVLLRRGTECFMQQTPRDREHLLTLLLAALVFAVLPVDAGSAHWRVLLGYGLAAAILLRTVQSLRRPVLGEYGRGVAAVVALPAVALAAAFSLRAAQQALWPEHALELQRLQDINVGLMLAYLVGAAMFNFSFLTLVLLRLVRRLQGLSMHDALTGLPNRRAIEQALQREWQRWQRHGTHFGVVAIDLDLFKRVNDTHGHLAGDDLLTQVGQHLAAAVRNVDVLARTGGEEFLVLVPDTTPEGAMQAAERLRHSVGAAPFTVNQVGLPITISLGVALVRPADADLRALLARADRALYAAKAGGRNRVRLDDEIVASDFPASTLTQRV